MNERQQQHHQNSATPTVAPPQPPRAQPYTVPAPHTSHLPPEMHPVESRHTHVQLVQDTTPQAHHTPSSQTHERTHAMERETAAAAYALFLQRNGSGGDALTDWLEAERQVRARHGLG